MTKEEKKYREMYLSELDRNEGLSLELHNLNKNSDKYLFVEAADVKGKRVWEVYRERVEKACVLGSISWSEKEGAVFFQCLMVLVDEKPFVPSVNAEDLYNISKFMKEIKNGRE